MAVAGLVSSVLSCAAVPNDALTISLGPPEIDKPPMEDHPSNGLRLGVGEHLAVSIFNKYQRDVLLPAGTKACAIIAVKRHTDDGWQNWSDCSLRRPINKPVSLAPNQSIGGIRQFGASPSMVSAELGHTTVHNENEQQRQKPSLNRQSETENPREQGGVEHEVQQLQLAVPNVPLFERFKTLPAGQYQLVASYALSDQPETVLSAASPIFWVVEPTGDAG